MAMGAFGAHLLEPRLDALDPVASEQRLATYRTAAHYQLTHALAIGLVSVCLAAGHNAPRRTLQWSGGCFVAGVVAFSGPLYLLGVWGGPGWLGMIAPIGGSLLLAGWAFLLRSGWCWTDV